jgi:hypothetical protein
LGAAQASPQKKEKKRKDPNVSDAACAAFVSSLQQPEVQRSILLTLDGTAFFFVARFMPPREQFTTSSPWMLHSCASSTIAARQRNRATNYMSR